MNEYADEVLGHVFSWLGIYGISEIFASMVQLILSLHCEGHVLAEVLCRTNPNTAPRKLPQEWMVVHKFGASRIVPAH